MPDNIQPPLLSLAAIERAFSKQRLDAYTQANDADEIDRVARYLWNMALCTALQPALHVFEVTLRNAIYNASLRVVDTTPLLMPDVQCWLDAEPSLLYRNEREAVARAKAHLSKAPARRTAGHLISELSFGFWVQLMAGPYSALRATGPQLWPVGLPFAFPYRWAPDSKKNRPDEAARQLVFTRLQSIRDLRNRVAHHQPVWNKDLRSTYQTLLETLGWMSQKVMHAVVALDAFPSVMSSGLAPFHSRAARLLRGEAESTNEAHHATEPARTSR